MATGLRPRRRPCAALPRALIMVMTAAAPFIHRLRLGLTGVCLLLAPLALRAEPPAAVPPTVVSLAPHITEILYAAGAGAHVLAVDSSSDFPPDALALPRIGDALRVNPEMLLQLQPDRVWAWQSTQIGPELSRQLQQTGIHLTLAAPERLDDIPALVRRAGLELNTLEQANLAAAALEHQIAALRQDRHATEPITAFLEIGHEPLYTLARDPLTQDVLATCNTRNIYARHASVAPTVNLEDVLHRKPQVIIMAYKDPALLRARHQFWETHLGLPPQAVLNLNPDALYRPGPRLIDATRILCEQLDRYRASRR